MLKMKYKCFVSYFITKYSPIKCKIKDNWMNS